MHLIILPFLTNLSNCGKVFWRYDYRDDLIETGDMKLLPSLCIQLVEMLWHGANDFSIRPSFRLETRGSHSLDSAGNAFNVPVR